MLSSRKVKELFEEYTKAQCEYEKAKAQCKIDFAGATRIMKPGTEFTLKEVADFYGLPIQAVYAWINDSIFFDSKVKKVKQKYIAVTEDGKLDYGKKINLTREINYYIRNKTNSVGEFFDGGEELVRALSK